MLLPPPILSLRHSTLPASLRNRQTREPSWYSYQEGFGNSSVLLLGEGLQSDEGNLQGGAEPRQLVEREAHTLLTLPSDVSRTYRTDSTLGRDFLTKRNVVWRQLVDAGILPKQ